MTMLLLQPLSRDKDQPALTELLLTVNQFARKPKLLVAPNPELQLLSHSTLGHGEIDSKELKLGITTLQTDLSDLMSNF
jgi:hypothetical protein